MFAININGSFQENCPGGLKVNGVFSKQLRPILKKFGADKLNCSL